MKGYFLTPLCAESPDQRMDTPQPTMTNKELLIQMLQDGTWLDITDIVTKVDAIIEAQEKNRPGSSQGFYEELTQTEAKIRLVLMRENRRAIVNWVLIAYERAVTLNAQTKSLALSSIPAKISRHYPN